MNPVVISSSRRLNRMLFLTMLFHAIQGRIQKDCSPMTSPAILEGAQGNFTTFDWYPLLPAKESCQWILTAPHYEEMFLHLDILIDIRGGEFAMGKLVFPGGGEAHGVAKFCVGIVPRPLTRSCALDLFRSSCRLVSVSNEEFASLTFTFYQDNFANSSGFSITYQFVDCTRLTGPQFIEY